MTFKNLSQLTKHDSKNAVTSSKSSLFAVTILILSLLMATSASGQTVVVTNPDDAPADQQVQGSVPEDEKPAPVDDSYKGVVPGKNDVVEHTRVPKIHSKATGELTWIGYQKQDGKDRVFFQFDTLPEYNITEDGKTLIVVFNNTAPTATNFEREIDTSAFNSRIKHIDAHLDKKRGKTTVKIAYDGNNNYSASTEGSYLFIDFPH